MQGQRFPTWDALNPMAQAWVVTVADQRLHGTTFRKPAEAFQDEHLRSHLGRPPYVLQTSLVRPVARDCLVMVETNRYSVPAAYVGQRVEVQWGPGETVQIYHRGTLMATHRRVRGQPECCVEPAHYAALRRPVPSPSAGPGDEGMRLASWTGPFPDVEVRPLAWYEALVRQEVGHD